MPVILEDGKYAGYDAVELRAAVKTFNDLMTERNKPFAVIKIEDGQPDGGRFQIERTVEHVLIYSVLPVGLLYIAKMSIDGTEEIYGDDQTIGEAFAVDILNDVILNIDKVASAG